VTDSKLTEDEALALLAKLATDDDFRRRFEVKPARALIEIGVSPETVVNLGAKCLGGCRITSKEAFASALKSLDQRVIQRTMVMYPPWIRLKR
jgi:putative modified peptide